MDKGTVYILATIFPYEGGVIHGVYTSEKRAKEAATKKGYIIDPDAYDKTFVVDIELNTDINLDI